MYMFYLLHLLVVRGSHNAFIVGMQVPYLEDPNTGVQMFESAEIVEYLRSTYAI